MEMDITIRILLPIFIFMNLSGCMARDNINEQRRVKGKRPICFLNSGTLLDLTTTSYYSTDDSCDIFFSSDAQKFIYMNWDNIQVEAAKGGGEYIDALASLVNCKRADRSLFAENLKARYSNIFNLNRTIARVVIVEKAIIDIANHSSIKNTEFESGLMTKYSLAKQYGFDLY